MLAQFVLKIGFALAKKGGTGGGGWAYSKHVVHKAAALAACRTTMVGTGWTISHLVDTNGHRKPLLSLVGAPFPDL